MGRIPFEKRELLPEELLSRLLNKTDYTVFSPFANENPGC
jgi:hypothetical protein